MQTLLLDTLLSCPVDHGFPLRVEDGVWDASELRTGTLRCPTCDARYPVVAGIPHMLPPDKVQPAEVAAARQRELDARNSEASRYDREFGVSNAAEEHAFEL